MTQMFAWAVVWISSLFIANRAGGHRDLKLLQWMVENPNWHYGLDLVKNRLGSRGSIYDALSRLEDNGFVERQTEGTDRPSLRRIQYRATLKT